jgi:hypothetical protein
MCRPSALGILADDVDRAKAFPGLHQADPSATAHRLTQ